MSIKIESGPNPHPGVGQRESRNACSIARVVYGTLFVVGVLLCYLPLSPGFPADNLDSAWQWVMNEAVARHLVIGRDIVFTFGPFASVYTRQYHPATDALDMGGNLLLGLAFATGALCLARGRRMWLLAVVLVGLLIRTLPDSLYMALPPVLLFLTARLAMPRSSPLALTPSMLTDASQALLAASLGLLPLVKGSFGALSFAVGGVCFILQMHWSPRGALTGLILFAGTLIGGWVLTGQPLDALPNYFISMRPVISGYTDAMSVRGCYDEIVVYLAGAAIVFAFAYGRASRGTGLPGHLLALGLALVLFVTFKAGFVRHDAHAFIAFGTLLTIAMLVSFQSSPAAAALLVVIGFVGYLLADQHYMDLRTLRERVSNNVTAIARGAVRRSEGDAAMRAQYAENVEANRKAHALPSVAGSWDAYPISQNVVLANGVPWSPRPVFQSYSAYGTQLAQLNAAHLLSPTAAANLLFSVSPIDQRLPPLEDGVSWLTILNGYTLSGQVGDFLILRRTAHVEPAPLIPLGRSDTRLGELIPVPQSANPVWVKLELTPSILGRIAATILSAPEVRIELSFEDGRVESYRYIASMGSAGFLVSPLIRNTGEFAALISGTSDRTSPLERPVAIRIVPRLHSGILWSKRVTIELFGVGIMRRP